MKGAGITWKMRRSTSKESTVNGQALGPIGRYKHVEADRNTVRAEGKKVVGEHRRLLDKLKDY